MHTFPESYLKMNLHKSNQALLLENVILRQKLKQKGFTEIRVFILYCSLNATITAIFSAGAFAATDGHPHSKLIAALLWTLFVAIFFSSISALVVYYAKFFEFSKYYSQVHNLAEIKKNSCFVEATFFPPYNEGIDPKRELTRKQYWKKFFTNFINPETLRIRAKTWSASIGLLIAFAFVQHICAYGVDLVFDGLEDPTRKKITIIVSKIIVIVILSIIYLITTYAISQMIWAPYYVELEKKMTQENIQTLSDLRGQNKNSSEELDLCGSVENNNNYKRAKFHTQLSENLTAITQEHCTMKRSQSCPDLLHNDITIEDLLTTNSNNSPPISTLLSNTQSCAITNPTPTNCSIITS